MFEEKADAENNPSRFPWLLVFLLFWAGFGNILCEATTENFVVVGRVFSEPAEPFGPFDAVDDVFFVVQGTDLVVIDLSQSANPAEVSRLPLHSTPTVSAVLTNGSYVFVRTSTQGLQVYDYRVAATPAYLGRFGPYDTSSPVSLALEDDRLYFGGQAFSIFDVSNPATPVELASHPFLSSQMVVTEGRALLTGDIRDPLLVYDVRDPANPVYLGELDYYHASANEPAWHPFPIAGHWPRFAVMNAWKNPSFPIQTCWALNVYTANGDGSWDSVHREISCSLWPYTMLCLTSGSVFFWGGIVITRFMHTMQAPFRHVVGLC